MSHTGTKGGPYEVPQGDRRRPYGLWVAVAACALAAAAVAAMPFFVRRSGENTLPQGDMAPAVPEPATPLPVGIADFEREARQTAQTLCERFPDSNRAQCVKALLENNLGNTAEAMEIWTACLHRDPAETEALHSLAVVANQKGEHEKAEQLLRKVISLSPDDRRAPAQLAAVLVSLGRPKDAIALLEQSVRAGYQPVSVLSRLGQAYLQVGEYAKAKAVLEAVAARTPDDKNAYYGLARACERLGEKAKAREYLGTFKRLSAKDIKAAADRIKAYDDLASMARLAVLIHVEAGKVYLKQGHAARAEQEWRRAAALGPQDTDCRMALASFYERANRAEDAMRMCEELRDIDPAKAEYWLYLGLLRARLNQRDAARAAVAKAAELEPDNPKYREILAAMSQ